MTILSTVLLFFIGGLGAWGWIFYRQQRLKNLSLDQKLKKLLKDATEQKELYQQNKVQWEQTEEKLRSFLKLMDTLMNTIPNPIYFKDVEGVFQGCNKVFAKQILGLTRDLIIGKRPNELSDQIPADLASVYQREERKMIEKAGIHTHENQALCTEGQRRDFLFSLAPVMDNHGEINGSVAVLSDLTDKNRAAQNRIQKEKLEGVLETAGAVCHELNQPLQTLSGYTELIAMKLDDLEAMDNIEKIITQIERMRDLTNKLQGITRYETTDYSGNTKIIDIDKASKIM